MTNQKLIIGTFQNRKYEDLHAVINAAVTSEFTSFDTAPSYGTEVQLGKAIRECYGANGLSRKDFFVSDKIDAWQMREGNGDIEKFVLQAIDKMQIEYLDLLLIHWPIEEYLSKTWECMQSMKKKGVVKEVGICNVRVRHLKEYASKGIFPKVIQIERHPLRTCDEEMEYCRLNDIKVLSYSPLCRMHQDIKNSDILQALAKKYGKNIGQIILRWHIDTGSCPVFMSKKPSRIKENANIFDFKLEDNEIKDINKMNKNYKIFLESWGCPGF